MAKCMMIFEPDLRGHRLEYLHHLYSYFNEKADGRFSCVFIVPNSFNPETAGLKWSESKNCKIISMTKAESQDCLASGVSAYWARYRTMKSYIQSTQSNLVFFISLMSFLPSVLCGGGRSLAGASVSGIIYSIYTRNNRGKWYEFRSSVLFWLMAKLPVFQSVFLLNDQATPRLFNSVFKSSKFEYLPDPYVPLDMPLRNEDQGARDGMTFLHFGGLTSRKGTLEILQAAELLLNKNDVPKCRFIFAGKVYPDIREEFYRRVEGLQDQVEIQVYDEFCEYQFLGELCQKADCLLMPYKMVGQSSGLLGFAAQFGIPVLAPSQGLLGKIVKDYQLGYTLKDSGASAIADAICELNLQIKSWIRAPKSDYLSQNSVGEFCGMIDRIHYDILGGVPPFSSYLTDSGNI